MLDDRQRHTRKRVQDALCSGLVGALLLVLWVHMGEAGLILRKRPPQDKLHDRQHADTERQEVREALDLLVELDKQRRDMDAAFEAIEDTFDAVFIAVAQDRLLQRQPRPWRIGHKSLPAEPLGAGGNGLSLAGAVGDAAAGFLYHAFIQMHSTSASAPVLWGLVDLVLAGHP